MTWSCGGAEMVPTGWLCSAYAGGGILGAAVPSAGVHGPSPVLNSLTLPADAAKEYYWRVVTPPVTGALTVFEDLTFTWTPPSPDATASFVYALYENYVFKGTTTVSLLVGTPGGGSVVSGAAAGDGGAASGGMGTAGASSASGNAMGGDGAAFGSMFTAGQTIDLGNIVPAPRRRWTVKPGSTSLSIGPIDVDEVKSLTFPFAREIGPATVAGVDMDCNVASGTDPSASSMLVGLPIVTGSNVTQRVRGRVAGVTYRIKATVTDNAGLVHAIYTLLTVRDE